MKGDLGNRSVIGTGTTRNFACNDNIQIYYQELGGEVAQLCVDDGSMFRAVVVSISTDVRGKRRPKRQSVESNLFYLDNRLKFPL